MPDVQNLTAREAAALHLKLQNVLLKVLWDFSNLASIRKVKNIREDLTGSGQKST